MRKILEKIQASALFLILAFIGCIDICIQDLTNSEVRVIRTILTFIFG